MRVLFWGTPDFALPSLRAVASEGHEIVGVVTQPDRPAGRGRKLRPSPVKEVASQEGLPILTPDRPRGKEFLDEVRSLQPDISIVVAYGHILEPDVLDLPRMGSINVHASLLPLLRGAAPVNWAIIRGHTRTGVTIMRMSEGMDEGPILLQHEVPISADDTATGLYLKLSEVGAEALIEALAQLDVDLSEAVEQDHSKATYAPKVTRQLARIDWSGSTREVVDHIRGMDMVPGAWTELDGSPVKFFRPEALDDSIGAGSAPGTVIEADADVGLVVKTGSGAAKLGEVQPAGKRRMEVAAWLRGGGVSPGSVLG